MKKSLSILTVLLLVAGMLHFSVARHYCGGTLAATKVSLSGALATCGMEAEYESCRHDQNGDQVESHCCDDDLTSYSIDNNYPPSARTASEFSPAKIAVPDMSFLFPSRSTEVKSRTWSDIGPPGILMTSSVDLAEIRTLRI